MLLVLNLRTKILILTKNLTKDLGMASEESSKGGSAEEEQVFFNQIESVGSKVPPEQFLH